MGFTKIICTELSIFMLSKDLNKNCVYNLYSLLEKETHVVFMSISFPPCVYSYIAVELDSWKHLDFIVGIKEILKD